MRAWLDDPANKLHMASFQASMDCLRKFKKGSVVRVGSVCTGWGVGDMVVGALTAILADRSDLKAPMFLNSDGWTWSVFFPDGMLDVDIQYTSDFIY